MSTRKPKPKRRTLWPMPVAEIIENPICLNLPNAAFGAFMRLCHHYWFSKCAPLPESGTELQGISRAASPVWVKYQEQIIEAFRDVQPALDRYFQGRQSNEFSLKIALGKAHAKRMTGLAARTAPLPAASVSLPPKRLASAAKQTAPAPKQGGMKDRIPLAA